MAEDLLQPGLRHFMTVDEMSDLGLSIFFTRRRLQRSSDEEVNARRFRSLYGSSAKVCVIIWEDLQTTTTIEAQIPTNKLNPRHFLMALHALKQYPTEIEREGPWDISKQKGREWVWYFLEKIQALQSEKISWPDNNFGTDIWAISVDGTHCWIEEPIHPEWSQDSEYYSHKFAKAGINYEIAISLSESRVVWINGPFKAGVNDISVFTQGGLEEKLLQNNKKAIGDKGYVGHPDTVSTYNVHDCEAVSTFKSRALKRHETFNNLTKRFKCLSGRFRHTPDRFQTCFESICVICQYQMENGSGLFDLLVEAIGEVEELTKSGILLGGDDLNHDFRNATRNTITEQLQATIDSLKNLELLEDTTHDDPLVDNVRSTLKLYKSMTEEMFVKELEIWVLLEDTNNVLEILKQERDECLSAEEEKYCDTIKLIQNALSDTRYSTALEYLQRARNEILRSVKYKRIYTNIKKEPEIM